MNISNSNKKINNKGKNTTNKNRKTFIIILSNTFTCPRTMMMIVEMVNQEVSLDIVILVKYLLIWIKKLFIVLIVIFVLKDLIIIVLGQVNVLERIIIKVFLFLLQFFYFYFFFFVFFIIILLIVMTSSFVENCLFF